ncbi:MAG: hypothetical protein OHK0045_07740 [Raineya sp.]
MDIATLLSPQIRSLIAQYRNKPASEVVLLLQKLPADLRIAIAEQIQGYQKALAKIPTFAHNESIIYPPKLNLEQSSSELTARWKANYIIAKTNTLTDLTGGFGVDAWAFSQVSRQTNYVEQNKDLVDIAKHNFHVLGANVKIYCDEAAHFLSKTASSDWIYIDPARRDKAGKSIAQITDTQPNIIELLPLIFAKTNNLLLKTSPMFDISQALQVLFEVKRIWVIAVENECREVLYNIEGQRYATDNMGQMQANMAIEIEAVNIKANGEYSSLKGSIAKEKVAKVRFSAPQKYLYEPNAAILKAGLFRYVADYFDVFKLHKHTHFYTNQSLKTSFQGRIFEIQGILNAFDWKTLKKHFPKAHIITRNYPMTVEQIRKQSQIKEGGEVFLIFTTWYEEQKGVIVAKKVKN